MCRLVLRSLIISGLCHIIFGIGEQNFNRTVAFTLGSGKNETGHWISNFVVDKVAPTLSPNVKVKVKQGVTDFGGVQSFHLEGSFIVPPSMPSDYEFYPGIGYYKFHSENSLNFEDARHQCAKEGGHLAIINSEEESRVLEKIFSRYPQSDWAYIGFHDRNKEGEYITIFGEPIKSTGFERWSHPNQPDDYNSGEDCGSIHRNGGLNDIGCEGSVPFICEYDLSWTSP